MVSEESEMEMTTNSMINKLNFEATRLWFIGSRSSNYSMIGHAQ